MSARRGRVTTRNCLASNTRSGEDSNLTVSPTGANHLLLGDRFQSHDSTILLFIAGVLSVFVNQAGTEVGNQNLVTTILAMTCV